ncbi:dihydropteroate synthase [Azospirillum sp. TSH7]|uniref:dihydropteroate synthase n=1 Tax=unclassified Azospirillum TaxID=2630922 RepID=UPI000D6155FA|nr:MULTISPECIES: dihydropteroate synthase [unclassified Azospirillum]PWC67836.1 dihydropteroate synthase [Azospirillum sp. TSH7]PWC71159.1 dihydropteroate synthase [Azospirillum sp. TSH20]
MPPLSAKPAAKAAAAKSAAGSLAGFCPWAGEDGVRVYLRPVGLMPIAAWAKGAAVPLAGGRFAFSTAELIVRDGLHHGASRIDRAFAPLSEIMAWGWERSRAVAEALDRQLGALTRARAPFAGLATDRPQIMGIVNVTPDSFSDGGDFFDPAAAIAHGEAMLAAGADILDIGGESTRPGAAAVAPEEEERRVLPVIRHFAAKGATVSVDTRHAIVMDSAAAAGARIINDIAGLGDPQALPVVARTATPVVVMHMQGDPGTMQANPTYRDAALDVFDWLEERVASCVAAGVPAERIAVDPGIGFGKSTEHNMEILRHTSLYHALGCTVLIGLSRKGFIGRLSRDEPPKERLPGSLAAGLETLNQGAQILRVHDVAETAQARAVWEGLHPRQDPP